MSRIYGVLVLIKDSVKVYIWVYRMIEFRKHFIQVLGLLEGVERIAKRNNYDGVMVEEKWEARINMNW